MGLGLGLGTCGTIERLARRWIDGVLSLGGRLGVPSSPPSGCGGGRAAPTLPLSGTRSVAVTLQRTACGPCWLSSVTCSVRALLWPGSAAWPAAAALHSKASGGWVQQPSYTPSAGRAASPSRQ